MNAKLKLGLLLIVIGGLVIYWFGPGRKIVNAPPRRGPIVALGDSLSSGVGAPLGQAWPDHVGSELGVKILNRGVPGNTIADAALRLEGDVLSIDPSIVIVFVGGNDLLAKGDLDQAFADLERLVRRIQADGAVVVLVGLESIIPLQGVGRRYKRVARATGSVYVPDILDDIFGDPSKMADYIHPNAAGHRLMARRIAKALDPYVK